ncbi:hypothetical protein MBT84_06020 [Streptomyces sp. MBT84]|uniref:SDR family oxidoreductase n=1 Tax=Streptomyces sp. MBT84 TaxID=1488414 RepID=UPI001D94D09E|nr:hypothetical protein [Streptomyces sp. MBT84]MBW8699139.1 hypothetical protein [Streptomyces sp. MBT84]
MRRRSRRGRHRRALTGEGVGAEFFTTATGDLLEAATAAGVEHYVALSMVAADRVRSGYFRAKAAQENLARRATVPYSLMRTTPFFESVEAATAGSRPDGVHVPPLQLRPVSTDDVATMLAHVAASLSLFGVLEEAGPEDLRLEDATAELLTALGRPAR